MTTTLETRDRLTPGAASSALVEWHYSPSLESTDHVKIAKKYNLFIGGQFVEPHSKRWFETINPATEQTLAEIAEGDAEDVDRAVKEARRAYEKVWRKIGASERAKYIFRIARLIQEKSRALAVVETMNGGKPIKESRDIDIPLAAAHFFDYAPLDQAIEGIINGIYFNQGHVCCAGSRLFVQESVVEPVIRKLRDRIGTLRVGNPLDKNTDVGAINSRAQLEKIQELVDSGVEEGAEMFQSSCSVPDRGFWFRPTFFTGVAQSSRIAQEEIFGPVLSVLTFRTPEEAIEKANNTPYGLSAGVWTEKGSRILKMAAKLRAGVIWANTYNKFDPSSPFGGFKESGFGREGGMHGLAPYVRLSERRAQRSANLTSS